MRAVSTISLWVLLSTCHGPPTLLQQVLDSGELRVVTRNSPTTYYLGSESPVGPEYELASRFAEYLGVELDIYTVNGLDEMLAEVESGRAQVAAAGLTATDARRRRVEFGPSYREVTEQLVYRAGEPRPENLDDLAGGRLAVLAGSSHAETLAGLKPAHPGLHWEEHPTADEAELLEALSEGAIDYTVTDDAVFAVSRYFHPDTLVAFDITEPRSLAWALPRGDDESLRDAVRRFFDQARATGLLAAIDDRYFGHVGDFDYVGARTFLHHVDTRLPRYRLWFQDAADAQGLDWRLLAAMGYQESHWNPSAVSPTGVKGIMMLTRSTARSLGIQDRKNPRESILGGAAYFLRVKAKIPDRIPEPDRTWLALAAYNVGWGHLEDARIITEIRGGNPDAWAEVRESLPLLAQRKWYSRVKRGYARGWEPVQYVDNIRNYYEVLTWLTADGPREPVQAEAPEGKPEPQPGEPA